MSERNRPDDEKQSHVLYKALLASLDMPRHVIRWDPPFGVFCENCGLSCGFDEPCVPTGGKWS